MTSQLPDVVKIICFAKKDSDGSTEALPAQDPLELQDWEQEQEPEPVTDPLIGAEPEQIGLEPELDCDPFQLDQAADDDIVLLSPDPEPVAECQVESESDLKSEPDSESDCKSEIKSELESEQESEFESGSNFELETDLESGSESEPDPGSDWASDFEPEPKLKVKKPLKISLKARPKKTQPVARVPNNLKRKRESKKRTKTVPKELNPEWNEKFYL